jgi:ubiquinone/menaquinone biosynthesis C-methylase UbiE
MRFTYRTLTAVLVCATIFSAVAAPVTLKVATEESLLRTGMAPFKTTVEGKAAAQQMADGIRGKDADKVRNAVEAFEQLMQTEQSVENYSGLVWIGRRWLAANGGEPAAKEGKYYDFFFERFSEDGYKQFIEMLRRVYEIDDFEPDDMELHIHRKLLLQDMLMFNNPLRDQWSHVEKLMQMLRLEKGERVLDIGSGFGYYTHRIARAVGPEGRAYAIDTVSDMTDAVPAVMQHCGLGNVVPVHSSENNIKVVEETDAAFICSLYHIIYGWSNETNRSGFLASIKRSLRKGGRLFIVDNYSLRGNELNSCYVYPQLIQAQLYFYGFTLERQERLSKHQYLMVFRHETPEGELELTIGKDGGTAVELPVDSGKSVIHIGSLDTYDVTERGIAAAKIAYKALNTKDKAVARKAIEVYEELVPMENFGGEYSAIKWFCEYIAAGEEERRKMLQDPLTRDYFEFLGGDDFKLLKTYVKYKYKIEPETVASVDDEPEGGDIGKTRRDALEDFILFNNPYRPQWENTAKILELMRLEPSSSVVDIGCGAGYFTYRLARQIGPEGKVYALDIKEEHIDHLLKFNERHAVPNVIPRKSEIDDIKMAADSVDVAYMCSLYHIIYGVNGHGVREKFLHSIKKALRKDGRLVIVDNGPVRDSQLPYHGPYIRREMIVAQLGQYGFELVANHQIIPQRYFLEFKHVSK